MSILAFRAFTAADLPLLASWLQQPHVSRWYGGTGLLDDVETFIDAEWIDPLVLTADGRPVGYLQAYRPHDYKAAVHPYSDLPRGAVGIDMLIGDPALVGQGLGPCFCEAFARSNFAVGKPCLVADPHPDNSVGIRAYRKAGFVPGRQRDTPWGRVLLMTRTLQSRPAAPGSEEP